MKPVAAVAFALANLCLWHAGWCAENTPEPPVERPAAVVAGLHDGATLKAVPVAGRALTVTHGVSPGLLGVIVFAAEGFRPAVTTFQASTDTVTVDVPVLFPLEDATRGVVVGVVASVATGGKQAPKQGVRRVFGGEGVELSRDRFSASMNTGDNGVFYFTVPPGEYRVTVGGRDMGKVGVEPGKTTVKIVQKGSRLVD